MPYASTSPIDGLVSILLRKEEGRRNWCGTYDAVGLTTVALLIDEAYAGVRLIER